MNVRLIYITIVVLFLLPAGAKGLTREISAAWEYQEIANLTGFILYRGGVRTCSTSDPDATSIRCTVDIPDGESQFTLTALFGDGTESPHSAPFPCTFTSTLNANFTFVPLSDDYPLVVDFDASGSSGSIVSHQWLFGDGDTAIGSMTSHTYATAGSYTVTLRVADVNGISDSETAMVTVTSPKLYNTPPSAVISSSTGAGTTPLTIHFDGASSADIDGSILSHFWDFGDGETARGSQVSHTYTIPGTYSATLTVSDDGGLTDTVSTPVVVQSATSANLVPTAMISASSQGGREPLDVVFNAANSSDPDGKIVSYSWNFGDGTSSTSSSLRHTYHQEGQYVVTLEVTDDKGAISSPARLSITVNSSSQEMINPIIMIINHILLKSSPDKK